MRIVLETRIADRFCTKKLPVENSYGEILGILWFFDGLPTKSWEHPAGFTVPAGCGAQTPSCEGVWVEIDEDLYADLLIPAE